MKEIKLPLCESPIRVYSNYAYILSVLLNQEEAKDWFYSNFIQVKYREEIEKSFLFNYSLGNLSKYFYNVPFLEVRSIKRTFLLKVCPNIIAFLCSALAEGYYIMTIADNYFLPVKSEYNNNHTLHLIMIHGYNLEQGCFYSMGFDGPKYEESTLNFDDFYKAFTSMDGKNVRIRDDMCMLYKLQDKKELLQPRQGINYFSYEFNLNLVKRSLQEYLNSICSDEHFDCFYQQPAKMKYGITYYEAAEKYIQKYQNKEYDGALSQTAFHGMLEHKTVMVDRLKYMQEKGYVSNLNHLVDMYENIARNALKVRNYVLKYNMTYDMDLLEKIKNILNEMYSDEKNTVNKLIEALASTAFL